MAARARAAQGFLRRSWWTGIAITIAVPVLAGVGVYFFSKPYFHEIDQNQMAQSDLEKSVAKTSDNLNHRLADMEATNAATLSKLDDLRNEIRAIRTLRIELAPTAPTK